MTKTENTGYTITDAGTITLGKSVFTVRVQDMTEPADQMIWLTGANGATYFLRPFLGEDKGLRQVISWKSGQPLRKGGNEVRVYCIAGIIEVAA